MTYRLLADVLPRRFGSHSVRGIRPDDAEPIRRWRNAQLSVLRQSEPLSYEDQLRYFWDVVRPDFSSLEPRQILLTLLYDGSRVGYGGLTHLDSLARRAELSFLAAPEQRDVYAAHFDAFLQMLLPLAFEVLGLHRVWHETWARDEHLRVLETAGFEREGILRDHARVDGLWVDSVVYGMVAEGDQ